MGLNGCAANSALQSLNHSIYQKVHQTNTVRRIKKKINEGKCATRCTCFEVRFLNVRGHLWRSYEFKEWDLGSVGRRLDYSKAAAGILFPGPSLLCYVCTSYLPPKFNEKARPTTVRTSCRLSLISAPRKASCQAEADNVSATQKMQRAPCFPFNN